MPENDARRRQGEAIRRLHVFLALLHERGAAHGPRVVRPLHGHQRGDDFAGSLPQHGDQDQRNQDRRERKLDVDDAHDQRLDAPADVCGGESHREPDDECEHRCDDTDAEADPETVENRRQHVASLVVGAQPKGAARGGGRSGRQPAVHHVELRQVVRILRRDQRGEERKKQNQTKQREPEHGDRIRDKIVDDALERRFDGGRRHNDFPGTSLHPLLSAKRTRGSSAEYSTSTIRLITMKIVTMINR